MNTEMNLKCHSERSEESRHRTAATYRLGFFAALRMTGLGAGLLLGLLSVTHAAEPELRLSPRKIRDEVQAVVQAQLAALQKGDFETAYGFAARGIRRQFDEQLFALMIRRGYPALLRPGTTDLGVVRDDEEGSAQILVTLTDRQNRSTVWRYLLEHEAAGWRISGVVLEQKPPRGDT